VDVTTKEIHAGRPKRELIVMVMMGQEMKDWLQAGAWLATADENAKDEKSTYIRDCFDTLLYFMAMFDHYISSTLVLSEDVAYPMEYYVPLMAKFRTEVTAYLERYNLWRTKEFLARYPAWTSTSENSTVKINKGTKKS